MITIQEAHRLIMDVVPAKTVETLPLEDALHRVLATPIHAAYASPDFCCSSMDGIAVLCESLYEFPITLQIIGESSAGNPMQTVVTQGFCSTIFTGAELPRGTDTVIPKEHYEVNPADNSVTIVKPPQKGQYVRSIGEEYCAGDVLAKAGTIMTPRSMALLAQQGITTCEVWKQPRVALVSTGSEVVEPGSERANGQIYNSNTSMLKASIKESGATLSYYTHVADYLHSVVQALESAFLSADLVCTVGGVSVGDYDLIKPAAEKLGFTTVFWGVRQKPGKPLFFARRGEQILFGLPGNPVSVYMCFIQFVRPVLYNLTGLKANQHSISAILERDVTQTDGRAEYVRVQILQSDKQNILPRAVPCVRQDSYMLTTLTQSDGYVLVTGEPLKAGSEVQVVLW